MADNTLPYADATTDTERIRKRSLMGGLACSIGVCFWATWIFMEFLVTPGRELPIAFVTLGGFVVGIAFAETGLRKRESGWLAVVGLILCLVGGVATLLAIVSYLFFPAT
jgi:uncharacterized membrane protein